jgi:antitoxin (DNA-binding transcriptional repressor) of toxin-antitoxin stability system
MRAVSVREMRALLPGLEDELARSGELIVTRRGRPIARLMPVGGGRPTRPSHAAFMAGLPFQDTPSEALARDDRDERG